MLFDCANLQLAVLMATKASYLSRELKSIKSEFGFMQERCNLLEEENRRLHDVIDKGGRAEEDDLVLFLCNLSRYLNPLLYNS